MTTYRQLTNVPNVAYTALRFTLGGIIGCVTLSTTLSQGGILALIAGPIAFFVGAFWAAGALHLGVRGRLGFGLATMISMFFSFLILVGTQAMHGTESIFLVVLLIAIPFIVANAIGSLIGTYIIHPDKVKTVKYTVKGFVIGSIVVSVILVAEMGIGILNFDRALPLLPVPGIAGGTAAAWALRSVRRQDSEPDQ